jgi:hypothetical protein
MGNYCLMAAVSVGEDEVLEMDGGDGWWRWMYNNVHVANVTELQTELKIVKMLNLKLSIVYHNKTSIHWNEHLSFLYFIGYFKN